VDVAAEWGASGLAYLTGMPAGPPDFSRSAVLAEARRVAEDIRRRCGVELDAAAMLAGRAALLGLSRGGDVSAGGATRLLQTRDGYCAITLSRTDDVDTLPALLELDALPDGHWSALGTWLRERSGAESVYRARLLGIPAAVLGEVAAAGPAVRRIGPQAPPRPLASLLVADLSSMWAGPLVGRVLVQAGATVVKVETASRPDGTRSGSEEFFNWMNAGKLSYAVGDIGEARALVAAADVVVTSSRPTALAQRGIQPERGARPGRIWLRITGYGAEGERAHWVAFGDDAAVAGGLVGDSSGGTVGRDTARPVFCGDAIADPLTGLAGALGVVESHARGGGELIDVALASVAATYAALPQQLGIARASPPASMAPCPPAPPLGADNARVEQLILERSCATC
jgi:CoA transferase family III